MPLMWKILLSMLLILPVGAYFAGVIVGPVKTASDPQPSATSPGTPGKPGSKVPPSGSASSVPTELPAPAATFAQWGGTSGGSVESQLESSSSLGSGRDSLSPESRLGQPAAGTDEAAQQSADTLTERGNALPSPSDSGTDTGSPSDTRTDTGTPTDTSSDNPSETSSPAPVETSSPPPEDSSPQPPSSTDGGSAPGSGSGSTDGGSTPGSGSGSTEGGSTPGSGSGSTDTGSAPGSGSGSTDGGFPTSDSGASAGGF